MYTRNDTAPHAHPIKQNNSKCKPDKLINEQTNESTNQPTNNQVKSTRKVIENVQEKCMLLTQLSNRAKY